MRVECKNAGTERLPIEMVLRLERFVGGDPVTEEQILRFIGARYGARSRIYLPPQVAEAVLKRPADFIRAGRIRSSGSSWASRGLSDRWSLRCKSICPIGSSRGGVTPIAGVKNGGVRLDRRPKNSGRGRNAWLTQCGISPRACRRGR